jgi:hypothetical protein
MEKKKQPEPDNKEQSDRFVEIAQQIKADDDKDRFEKACTKIVKPKPVK